MCFTSPAVDHTFKRVDETVLAKLIPYFSGGVLARLFPTALGKVRRKRYKGLVGNNLEKEKCAGNRGKANKQEVTAGDLPHLNPLLSERV